MANKKAYDLRHVRIFVVDDDRHMQLLLRTIVRNLGVEVIGFDHLPHRAYQTIPEFKPDILLLDLEMPDINGFEFARKMRTDPTSPNLYLPMIAISASADHRHVTEARDAGINEFLAKPISPANVYARIVSIIERPRLFVRLVSYSGPCRRRHRKFIFRGVERRADGGKKLTQAQIDQLIE